MVKEENHAWFSQKQFENKEKSNKWIYWKLENEKIVLISEITNSKNYTSKFDDVNYLGKAEKFYGSFNNELIQ